MREREGRQGRLKDASSAGAGEVHINFLRGSGKRNLHDVTYLDLCDLAKCRIYTMPETGNPIVARRFPKAEQAVYFINNTCEFLHYITK